MGFMRDQRCPAVAPVGGDGDIVDFRKCELIGG